MAKNKLALLGLHNNYFLRACKGVVEGMGYHVESVTNYQDMLEKCKTNKYDLYFMDLNLGIPNSLDITPAIKIYALVEQRVEKGEARFIGVSGNEFTVKRAQDARIPARNRDDKGLIKFLEN